MTRPPKTPQQRAVREILRELAPVVGERRMEYDGDLILFVTVRRPSRQLLAFLVSPEGNVEGPVAYKAGVHQGVRIRPAGSYWDAPPRSPQATAARLPRFRDVAEAVRFLADFPMIPTADDGALVRERDRAAGRMGSLGGIVETDRGPLLNREGGAA